MFWSAALFLFVVHGFGSLAVAETLGQLGSPVELAQIEEESSEANGPRRSLFKIYRGVEPKRVRSKSKLDGARSTVEIGKVLQGDLVVHEIMIANETREAIVIDNLKMCSGCFLESHSKEVSPGLQGSILFVIPTDSLAGQELAGTITGTTSSPDLPAFTIEVTAKVQEFAKLSPYRVWLKGKVGTEIVASSVIVPHKDYAFSILEVKARKGVWFEHSFSESERDGAKVYEIKVTNTRTKPGPYQDVLFVKTDHPERPEFKIRIEGRIEK